MIIKTQRILIDNIKKMSWNRNRPKPSSPTESQHPDWMEYGSLDDKYFKQQKKFS